MARITALPAGVTSRVALPRPARRVVAIRATAEFSSASYQMSSEDIKAALLDSLYGTERGLTARSEVRFPARPPSGGEGAPPTLLPFPGEFSPPTRQAR